MTRRWDARLDRRRPPVVRLAPSTASRRYRTSNCPERNLAPAGDGRAQLADTAPPTTAARYVRTRLGNGPQAEGDLDLHSHVHSPSLPIALSLFQAEGDLDLRGHPHRLAVPLSGRELPLRDGLDRLLVQTQTQAAQHADVVRESVFPDFNG